MNGIMGYRIRLWVRWAVLGALAFFIVVVPLAGITGSNVVYIVWVVLGLLSKPMRYVMADLVRAARYRVSWRESRAVGTILADWDYIWGDTGAAQVIQGERKSRIVAPRLREMQLVPGEVGFRVLPIPGQTVADVLATQDVWQQVTYQKFGDASFRMTPQGGTVVMQAQWRAGDSLTPAEMFLPENWPTTAMQIEMTGSTYDPALPASRVVEHDDGAFTVTLTPRAGTDAERLTQYAGQIKTITGMPYVDVKHDGLEAQYTVSAERRDPYPRVIPWPGPPAELDFAAVPVGVTSTGEVATMPLVELHTRLVAVSGAGKGSVLWSMLGAVAGRDDVEIRGIDFKRGMEFRMNDGIFTTLITDPREFAAEMIMATDDMEARMDRMADRGERAFTPSVDEPLMLYVIDEALAVEQNISQLARDEAAALGEAMHKFFTQGRAAGYVMFCAMQSPYKSQFRWSDMFTNTVALRLADDTAQVSALGAGSIDKVGELYNLDTSRNGPDKGRGAIQIDGRWHEFKAYYPTDEQIRELPATPRRAEEVPESGSTASDADKVD